MCVIQAVPFPGSSLQIILTDASEQFNGTLGDLELYAKAVIDSYSSVQYYLDWRSYVAMLLLLVFLFLVFW